MVIERPHWFLGQIIPDGWTLPDYTSRSINVAWAACVLSKKNPDNAKWLLKLAIKYARDGVELVPRYQK